MEDRSQYLGLAQLSQGVVRNLLLFLEADNLEPLRSTLSKIVEPLEAFVSVGPVPPAAAFATYEALNTLNDAWGESETKEIVDKVKKLLAAGNGPESKREAQELLAPFQRLSAQALLKFEQPESTLPASIFKLCGAQ